MVEQHPKSRLIFCPPRLLSIHIVQVDISEERNSTDNSNSSRKTHVQIGGKVSSETDVEDIADEWEQSYDVGSDSEGDKFKASLC